MARTFSSRVACAPLLAVVGLLGCSNTEQDSGGVSKIVYAVRQNTTVNADGTVSVDVAGGMGQVMDYGRYVAGGRLETYDLHTGNYQNITEDYPQADISSVDVSFDATKVVFTMKTDSNSSYHVYWAGLERGSNGKFEVHQLTFGGYDDQNAVFAPGGRIVFTTNEMYTEMGTRADEYEHSRVVTQLATISLTGGDADRKLCPQNLSHIVTLFPMHDGRVGFSRWEHLENVNDVKVFAMNPDCTQIVAISGQHGKPGNSVVQVTESATTPNVFYGIVTNRERTIQAGSLVQIDARSATAPGQFDEEKSEGQAYSVITPWVPRDDSPSPVGRYRSPAQLPDGSLLVSWANGVVNDQNELSLTPPDYGVYVYNAAGNIPIVDHFGTWELYAKPVVARAEPPAIPTRNDVVDSSMPARFGSINVGESSLYARHQETISGAQFADGTHMDDALTTAKKVRIIEGFSTEAAAGVTMFGLTMAEGAAIIGEAKVESDGSWLADLPPYIPMHLQPLDEFDMAIRSQTTWIQGLPGEDRVCGGCHEDRNKPIVPNGQGLTHAASRGAENFMEPISQRTEYPWAAANDPANPNQVQTLLTAKCVGCHNDTTNGSGPQTFYTVTMNNTITGTSTAYQIPRFDMSETPVTVVYDRKTHTWPSSYVSIFYPAALSMEMGMGATVTGTVPPTWGVPSDARHSAMIEKLNITSFLTPTTYAWTLGDAFSDTNIAGGTRTDHAKVAGLTREETVMLIRSIDMGGQYFARQNSQFQPFTTDPVAPKAF